MAQTHAKHVQLSLEAEAALEAGGQEEDTGGPGQVCQAFQELCAC